MLEDCKTSLLLSNHQSNSTELLKIKMQWKLNLPKIEDYREIVGLIHGLYSKGCIQIRILIYFQS